MSHYFFSSLTRISDLASTPFSLRPLDREAWATGDYVAAEVIPPVSQTARVELTDGRLAGLLAGDKIVGAFGVRRATLEAVGDWYAIGDDRHFHNLTAAGLFGRVTSQSFLLPPLTNLSYCGHLWRGGKKVSMKDFVPDGPAIPYRCPTIAIVGTSMSAGKTTAARIIIHQLKELGLKVIGTKLTGAGRYRDILSMGDAGADSIFDFVDGGLPSSIVPPEEFRTALRQLLSRIAAEKPDVVVAEAGASPLEPYNGSVVLEEMAGQICFTLLCASDPYAVVGVIQGFGLQPDLISGIATNTTAGVELVEKLTGVRALPLSEPSSLPLLRQFIQEKLQEKRGINLKGDT